MKLDWKAGDFDSKLRYKIGKKVLTVFVIALILHVILKGVLLILILFSD